MKNVRRLALTLAILAGLFSAPVKTSAPKSSAGQAYVEEEFSPQRWYDTYNDEYFLGALPQADAYFGEDQDYMGLTYIGEHGFRVMVSEKLNPSPREARMTILHEMCHVVTWHTVGLDAHGPKWQECMHTLAARGAFDDLW